MHNKFYNKLSNFTYLFYKCFFIDQIGIIWEDRPHYHPKFKANIAKKKNLLEKTSSGMGEMSHKILGGYEY